MEITDLEEFIKPQKRLTIDKRLDELKKQGIEVAQVSPRTHFLSGLEECVRYRLPRRYLKDGIEYMAGFPVHITIPTTEVTFEILRFQPNIELYRYRVEVPQMTLARYQLLKEA